MNTITKLNAWFDARKAPLWMDLLRMLLGGYIIAKGIMFMLDFGAFTNNILSVGWVFIAIHIAHYIIFIHLVGGMLISLGAYTRLSAAINIPILLGAVDLNLIQMQGNANYMEFVSSVIVLLLLAAFFVYGEGKISITQIRRNRESKKTMNLSPH